MSRAAFEGRLPDTRARRGAAPRYEAPHINALQHSLGNRAVQRLLKGGVQRLDGAGFGLEPSAQDVQAAALRGIQTPASSLPFLERLEPFFPDHNLRDIEAHAGKEASTSAEDMDAKAFAIGKHVVFGQTPDLWTTAHEVTHILQQQEGVQLSGGVGQEGDRYEQQANRVADKVVAGIPVGAELAGGRASQAHAYGTASTHGAPVQRLRLGAVAYARTRDSAEQVVEYLRAVIAARLDRIQVYYNITKRELDKRLRALVWSHPHDNTDISAANFETVLRAYLDQYYGLNTATIAVRNTRREEGAVADIAVERRAGSKTPHAVFSENWNGAGAVNLEADALYTNGAQTLQLHHQVHALVMRILGAWPGNGSPFEYLIEQLLDYSGGERTSANNYGNLVSEQESIEFRFGGGPLTAHASGRRMLANMIQHIVKLRARASAEFDLNVRTARVRRRGADHRYQNVDIAVDWNQMLGHIYRHFHGLLTPGPLVAPTNYNQEGQTMHELLTILDAAYGVAWSPIIVMNNQLNLREISSQDPNWQNGARAGFNTAMGHLRRIMWEIHLMLYRLQQGQY